MIEDLNLLRVFYYVARTEKISKAAEVLNVSQPAVSQHIKTLEEQAGFKLFSRSKKGVKLTNEAQEIFTYCKSIFAQIESINHTLENITSLDSGTLRIGASDTICKYYLIDKLKGFEKLFPKIRYRLTNCTTKESLFLLKNNEVDIAFVHSPIPNNHFTFQNCLTLEDFFVCSYDFDCSQIHTLKDLTKYRTLLLEKSSYSRKVLDTNLLKYNIELRPKFELASLDLLIEFAKKNMGIICVSKQYIEKELQNKELKIIPLKESLPPRAISLAYDKDNLSNAAKRFVEYI
ncbi:MAG: LysR family transcriptional regulator [Spirochaetales bacterium]|nr:LysR family transcriptional regulator [Spirochaetales bacterium]MBQ2294378.1 LysR family transcriptional regulator [Spirochaetales bacterium]